jgi:hypothetical protein
MLIDQVEIPTDFIWVRIIWKVSMSDMVKVSSDEFQKHIGRYQDVALVQPVTITRNGRDRTVMISADEYHRLKRRDRRVLGLDDFTDADLAAIRAAEPAPCTGRRRPARGKA